MNPAVMIKVLNNKFCLDEGKFSEFKSRAWISTKEIATVNKSETEGAVDMEFGSLFWFIK